MEEKQIGFELNVNNRVSRSLKNTVGNFGKEVNFETRLKQIDCGACAVRPVKETHRHRTIGSGSRIESCIATVLVSKLSPISILPI